jgi:hypothetical protein
LAEPLRPFRTVREILEHVADVHRRQLARYGDALADAAGYRRAAVLSYLREREAELVAAVARYEHGDEEPLESWVQSMPATAMAAAAREDPIPRDLDAILADSRARSDAMIQLYDQLAVSLVGPRAQAIFEDLAEQERNSQKRLRHALLDF